MFCWCYVGDPVLRCRNGAKYRKDRIAAVLCGVVLALLVCCFGFCMDRWVGGRCMCVGKVERK